MAFDTSCIFYFHRNEVEDAFLVAGEQLYIIYTFVRRSVQQSVAITQHRLGLGS